MADDADPLRRILRAARVWRVAPTVVMGRKIVTVHDHDSAGRVVRSMSTDWTPADTKLMLALEDYEAGLCPGCQDPLAETTKPEHEGAYHPDGPPTRCHKCTARALAAEVADKQENPAGLLYSFTLDSEVVELNKQPAPPLPPELMT